MTSRLSLLAVSLLLCACGGGGSGTVNPTPPPPAPVAWSWQDLGGPPALKSDFASNHEPLVVANGTLLLGTSDGIWRRPLAGAGGWTRAGLAGFTVHALRPNSDGSRLVAAGFDPADEAAVTVHYSTDSGASWVPASDWPRGRPGSIFERLAFVFYSLEPDPADPMLIYGGLEANSVAVSPDGGATWVMADGAQEPNFGFPCVSHRPVAARVLLQGCELPLDIAWVGATNVLEDDVFTLPGFRLLYGGAERIEQLGNRRINAIAGVTGRPARALVGVEGGLLELDSASGQWRDRADVSGRWIFRAEDTGTAQLPYAFISALAPLDTAGRHILFGGSVLGFNQVLSLFETFDGGATLARLSAPVSLVNPRVEYALRLAENDVLLVIGQTAADGEGDPSRLRVFRLTRP